MSSTPLFLVEYGGAFDRLQPRVPRPPRINVLQNHGLLGWHRGQDWLDRPTSSNCHVDLVICTSEHAKVTGKPVVGFGAKGELPYSLLRDVFSLRKAPLLAQLLQLGGNL